MRLTRTDSGKSSQRVKDDWSLLAMMSIQKASGVPWLPVSIGSSLGVVFLVLVLCIVCCVVRKPKPIRESVTNVNYSTTASKRDRFWRRRPLMESADTESSNRHRVESTNQGTPLDWNAYRNMAHDNHNRHRSAQRSQRTQGLSGEGGWFRISRNPTPSREGSRFGINRNPTATRDRSRLSTGTPSSYGSRFVASQREQTPAISRVGNVGRINQEEQTPTLGHTEWVRIILTSHLLYISHTPDVA
ncbi:hypothetical protein NP493_1100g02030 [Ridgeia piscesae]|uniref:Uncharacterized protein n=1 Tax=Ridgeia piscesae TaxID=27915 RepID=A0AAD9NI37_RIDPI|nr:hypothetical protein NP493_1100g02030 [Ridgeia piscesae]